MVHCLIKYQMYNYYNYYMVFLNTLFSWLLCHHKACVIHVQYNPPYGGSITQIYHTSCVYVAYIWKRILVLLSAGISYNLLSTSLLGLVIPISCSFTEQVMTPSISPGGVGGTSVRFNLIAITGVLRVGLELC